MEHYQPEFVIRYLAENTACDCPHCLSSEDAPTLTSIKFNNQQRDSLDVSCESAARQMLLNPEAFVLHAAEINETADTSPDLWLENLNQQCLNLAMHPAMTLETALYAIGVLLSKAQQYQDTQQSDPALLTDMAAQLGSLAEQGILAEQYQQLPQIVATQAKALKSLGAQRISFNLPMMEKMAVSLKVGELMVMNEAQLADRVRALQAHWDALKTTRNMPFITRNLLMYKLYHDVFPGPSDVRYGEKLLRLALQFFHLKMILAIWIETAGSELTDEALVSMFCSWHHTLDKALLLDISGDDAAASLLHAFSII
jgi:lysine-N-methylase